MTRFRRDGRPGTRVRQMVPDDLWRAVQPLLPPERPKPEGGRPRVPDRAALAGMLFVLRTGISWTRLPGGLGLGSGMTCWRRLREWQEAGAWPALRLELTRRLDDADRIDWSRAEPNPGGPGDVSAGRRAL